MLLASLRLGILVVTLFASYGVFKVAGKARKFVKTSVNVTRIGERLESLAVIVEAETKDGPQAIEGFLKYFAEKVVLIDVGGKEQYIPVHRVYRVIEK